MEQRILAVLDEAGEENANALLNTITDAKGDPGELQEFATAISLLIGHGLVTIVDGTEDGNSSELTGENAIAAIDGFLGHLTFDETRNVWTNRSRPGPPYPLPYPYILATRAGGDHARRILADRGADWWLFDQ